MGQIQDLEQRIAAAFARISAGVDVMASRVAAAEQRMPDETMHGGPMYDDPAHDGTMHDDRMSDSDLHAALKEQRLANAQLNERLAILKSHAADIEQDLQAEVETLTRHLDAQGIDLQRLSGTVAQLREDLRRLREAAVQGVVDPGLINKAMMAELDALRATRNAEVNEMNDILAALEPILQAEEERAHA